jgi:hypothetical protein
MIEFSLHTSIALFSCMNSLNAKFVDLIFLGVFSTLLYPHLTVYETYCEAART